MSELRYPNESEAYREARAALLKEEQELIDKVKSVAEKRRKLPPGGQLKEDYVFQWANDGKVGKRVTFSELFGDKNTLLLYSWMFGPNWDKPCPLLHVADGWVRPDLVFGRAERRVCRDRQGPGRTDQCVGQGTRMVADSARVWITSLPIRRTTNARATVTTCSYP